MSVRRHEQQTRTSDSGHGVLGVWLPFCGAGSVETYGGGILVVVEGDAAIPGVFGPQRGVPPGWVPCFCWLKQEEDEEEPTTVQKHSREGYNIAALLRSEEHTSELQSRGHLVCRLLLEKKKTNMIYNSKNN